MELKPEEMKFLKKYRRLSEHDKGYLDAMMEALENKKRHNMKLYQDEGRPKHDE